jgi:hypothetical protein
LLAFKHRGRAIQFKASTKGWAQMYLRKNPRPERSRRSSADYQQDALRQGHVAVNSILRNWIKGCITAVESGMLSFEAVFMFWVLTADGRPLVERLAETNLLPSPEQPKVIPLPAA